MKMNLDFIYPVRSIYETTSMVHPNILFGGTWELYGAGRVTVCRDESQSEFATIGKTGGSKYMQAHSHSYGGWIDWYAKGGTNGIIGTGTSAGSTSTEGQGNAGNLQPYIVVYRYRRIA